MDFRWSICQNVDQILKLIWHFKRLVVHKNVVLCGESKFFQYKRLLRNNLEIAAKICHQLNIHNGVIEHFELCSFRLPF
ncbi:hypothetical protein QQG55_49390 [Brugia pahangi]